jgi:hypothetical protein
LINLFSATNGSQFAIAAKKPQGNAYTLPRRRTQHVNKLDKPRKSNTKWRFQIQIHSRYRYRRRITTTNPVQFSSSSNYGASSSSELPPERFSSLHFNEQMLIDSLESPTQFPELQSFHPFLQLSIKGATPPSFRTSMIVLESTTDYHLRIDKHPIIPKTIQSHHVQFFGMTVRGGRLIYFSNHAHMAC